MTVPTKLLFAAAMLVHLAPVVFLCAIIAAMLLPLAVASRA